MLVRSRSALALTLSLLIAAFAAGCHRDRTVKVAWDAPAGVVTGYRILVDDHVVLNIPPPPLDPSCKCPTVTVPVPPGEHTITVIAYNQSGQSAPSAITLVK
jgi:hypothetical protein